MRIRKRDPALDDRGIYRLIEKELLPQTRLLFPDLKVDKKMIKERLQSGVAFVAKKARVAGFVNVIKQWETLYVDMLAVDRMFHKKGIGSALLTRAELYGREQGCRTAMLYVDELNDNAKRFYVKRGYLVARHVKEIRCYQLFKTIV